MYYNDIVSWTVEAVFVLCGKQPSVHGRLLLCPEPEVKSGQRKNSSPTHIPGTYLHFCMPLFTSISCYLYSVLYSIPFVFSVAGVDRGEVCNASSMDKQAARLNPNICVRSFPDHRELYVSSSLSRPVSVSQRSWCKNRNTVQSSKFCYYIKLYSRLKCGSFIHESIMVQLSHQQMYHQSAAVVCNQYAVLMLIPQTLATCMKSNFPFIFALHGLHIVTTQIKATKCNLIAVIIVV